MALVELSVSLDSAAAYINTYTIWTSVNIAVCFLRCFKFFSVQVIGLLGMMILVAIAGPECGQLCRNGSWWSTTLCLARLSTLHISC